jgi:nucleoside 2-deoxyribosyltransferase
MINIVGGFYNERCLQPEFREKFGSGLRACHTIRNIDREIELTFHTFVPKKEERNLQILGETLKMSTMPYESAQTITFKYDHPLRTPIIEPRPDLIVKVEQPIQFKADYIIYYGMLEGNAIVRGKKVVYDPQSPVKPISFHATGSEAEKLAVVINHREANLLAGTWDPQEIKDYFFQVEKVNVLVLKMGPKGAMVYDEHGQEHLIPVYKTSFVWKIGTGDVFDAIFGYYWMEADLPPHEAAEKASFMTALYSNTMNYGFQVTTAHDYIKPLNITDYPKGKVYLAGPFFHYGERWLIDQLYDCLRGLGMRVFSPWHHVGEGTVEMGVAQKDIEGLEECDIVFAVIDGLDPGTLFEVGYAIKRNIPVIVYVENEKIGDLTMLNGTGCIVEKDMTTALYKCLWMLAEKENG